MWTAEQHHYFLYVSKKKKINALIGSQESLIPKGKDMQLTKVECLAVKPNSLIKESLEKYCCGLATKSMAVQKKNVHTLNLFGDF